MWYNDACAADACAAEVHPDDSEAYRVDLSGVTELDETASELAMRLELEIACGRRAATPATVSPLEPHRSTAASPPATEQAPRQRCSDPTVGYGLADEYRPGGRSITLAPTGIWGSPGRADGGAELGPLLEMLPRRRAAIPAPASPLQPGTAPAASAPATANVPTAATRGSPRPAEPHAASASPANTTGGAGLGGDDQPVRRVGTDEINLQLVGRRIRLTNGVYRVVRYNGVDEKHQVQRVDDAGAPVESRQLRHGKYELLAADAHEIVAGASADDPPCEKCGHAQPGGIRSFEQACVSEGCDHRVAFGLGRASGVGSATTTARGEVMLAAKKTPNRPDYHDGNGSDSDGDASRGSDGLDSESDGENDEAAEEQAAEPPNTPPVAAAAPNQAQPLPPALVAADEQTAVLPNAAARKKQGQPPPPALTATLKAALDAAVGHQHAGAALVAAAPNQAAPPPLAPVANPAAAAQPQVGAFAQFDALRPQLAANPPADCVTCATDAALVAYCLHAQDPLPQALPAGWVTTAVGAISTNAVVGRFMEKVVVRTRQALAQGGAGVCIGPLNHGKCRYTYHGQPGRAKVYLWDVAGLQARAQVIGAFTAGQL